jgi:hypothetical protein
MLAPEQPLSLEQIAYAAGSSVAETEQMVRRLAAASLLDFDGTTQKAQLRAPVHAFLRSLELRQRRAESTRVAAARPTETKIGISYRREDSAVYAGRIYDRLSNHFGYDRVFLDIEQIEAGSDFVEMFQRQIAATSALIVLIGSGWTRVTDSSGRRRLANPNDFVRIGTVGACA